MQLMIAMRYPPLEIESQLDLNLDYVIARRVLARRRRRCLVQQANSLPIPRLPCAKPLVYFVSNADQ